MWTYTKILKTHFTWLPDNRDIKNEFVVWFGQPNLKKDQLAAKCCSPRLLSLFFVWFFHFHLYFFYFLYTNTVSIKWFKNCLNKSVTKPIELPCRSRCYHCYILNILSCSARFYCITICCWKWQALFAKTYQKFQKHFKFNISLFVRCCFGYYVVLPASFSYNLCVVFASAALRLFFPYFARFLYLLYCIWK